MMLKPSAAPGEPVLDGVGDLLGRAGEGAVPAPAAEPADELADGEAFAPGQVHDERVAALGALDLVLGGQVGRQLARPGRGASGGDPQDVRQLPRAWSGRMSSSSSRSSRRASASVEPMTGRCRAGS